MLNVLFSATPERWLSYEGALKESFLQAGLDVNLSRDHADPKDVDYVVFAPNGPVSDFTPYTNAKAVLSLWAGVDSIVKNPTLTQPLTRMVDTGLEEGMREYVTGHVLRHHLGMDRYILNDAPNWTPVVPPLARDRKVGILGLGALGLACAQSLIALNFQTLGWSRRAKDIKGMRCYAGEDGLRAVLSQAEILVLLLPVTAETENTLDAQALVQMPHGAAIINPGRGPLIDDTALLAALESGQISHATLDVFRIEPLPESSPFWTHKSVTVTPHIASETRAKTASDIIADNIKRSETGQPLRFLVDRSAGY